MVNIYDTRSQAADWQPFIENIIHDRFSSMCCWINTIQWLIDSFSLRKKCNFTALCRYCYQCYKLRYNVGLWKISERVHAHGPLADSNFVDLFIVVVHGSHSIKNMIFSPDSRFHTYFPLLLCPISPLVTPSWSLEDNNQLKKR